MIIKVMVFGRDGKGEIVAREVPEDYLDISETVVGEERTGGERDYAPLARAFIEMAAAQEAIAPAVVLQYEELLDGWSEGAYAIGAVRNHEGQTWRCCQAHDTANNPDIVPGASAGAAFWVPYHGTDAETARKWVAPTGAHDIYKVGECMIWTDDALWRCRQNTNFSPAEYGAAWEVIPHDD